jgi:hypothetical protein
MVVMVFADRDDARRIGADAAAGLARDWFLSHLPRSPAVTG